MVERERKSSKQKMHSSFPPAMSSLEEFLRRRLAEWGYDDPSEAEYTAGIIEEESLEDADKLEAILGILNTDLENGQSAYLSSL